MPTNTEKTNPNERYITWINNASYEQLLSKWRYASAGSPFFQGDVGQHYKKVMAERKQQVGHAEHVRASKNIG